MERIKQLIGSARYKMALDTDVNLKLNLHGNLQPIKSNLNKIISTVSQEQVFREERLNSNKYRFLGRLNIFTDNSVNTLDNNSALRPNNNDWDPLFDGSQIGGGQPKAPNNWVLQILYPNKMVKYENIQNNSAYKGVTIENINPVDVSGKKQKLFLTTYTKHGLLEGDFCYIYSNTQNSVYTNIHKVESLGEDGENFDKKLRLETNYVTNETDLIFKKIVNPSDDDINFNKSKEMIRVNSCDISGGTLNSNYTLITTGNLTPTFSANTHNLRESDYIDIRVNDNNYFLNGLHRVEKIIDRFKCVIDLKISNNPNTVINNINIPFRRLDGTPSDYYIRKFKLISSNDYEVSKATAFGSSIYPKTITNSLGVANDTWLFTFLEDTNLSGLYSHRGGVITELYIATIKRAGENTFGWSNVTAHWDYMYSYADQSNSIERISSFNPNSVGTIEKGDPFMSEYYGDFVEYNRFNLIENRLSEVIHRFTLNSSPTLENGYYIKPFQKIEIKKFSELIEEAIVDVPTSGIPGDSEKLPNGNIIWRDLLEPGFIENGDNGVDYPFLNGSSYIYTNKNIFIKRQKYAQVLPLFQDLKTSVLPIQIC